MIFIQLFEISKQTFSRETFLSKVAECHQQESTKKQIEYYQNHSISIANSELDQDNYRIGWWLPSKEKPNEVIEIAGKSQLTPFIIEQLGIAHFSSPDFTLRYLEQCLTQPVSMPTQTTESSHLLATEFNASDESSNQSSHATSNHSAVLGQLNSLNISEQKDNSIEAISDSDITIPFHLQLRELSVVETTRLYKEIQNHFPSQEENLTLQQDLSAIINTIQQLNKQLEDPSNSNNNTDKQKLLTEITTLSKTKDHLLEALVNKISLTQIFTEFFTHLIQEDNGAQFITLNFTELDRDAEKITTHFLKLKHLSEHLPKKYNNTELLQLINNFFIFINKTKIYAQISVTILQLQSNGLQTENANFHTQVDSIYVQFIKIASNAIDKNKLYTESKDLEKLNSLLTLCQKTIDQFPLPTFQEYINLDLPENILALFIKENAWDNAVSFPAYSFFIMLTHHSINYLLECIQKNIEDPLVRNLFDEVQSIINLITNSEIANEFDFNKKIKHCHELLKKAIAPSNPKQLEELKIIFFQYEAAYRKLLNHNFE